MSNLSDLLPAGASGKTIEATATATITGKAPVILNAAGTVTQAGESNTTLSDDFIAGSGADATVHKWASGSSVAWDSADTNKFLAITERLNVIYGIVGTVSGSGGSTSISLGTPTSITSSGNLIQGLAADPNNAGKFVITYQETTTTKGMAIAVVFSGASGLTIGTAQEYDDTVHTGESYYGGITADPNVENQYIIQWREPAGNKEIEARVMTLASGSGTTMTFGTAMTVYDPSGNECNNPMVVASKADAGLFISVYGDGDNSDYGAARCLSLSGTTITSNTATVFQSNGQSIGGNCCFNPDVSGQFVTVFGGYGAGGYTARQTQARVGTLNTSTKALTFGSIVTTNLGPAGSSTQAPARICAMGFSSNAFLLNYLTQPQQSGISQNVGTISSGTLTFGTKSQTYPDTAVENAGSGSGPDCAADPNNAGRAVSVFVDSLRTSGNDTRTFVTEVGGTYTSSNLTASNYVGIADAAITSDATFVVTVGGGKFVIDGVSQDTVSLQEGATYTFDQAAGTNSTHPLRFSTTSDGTHGGGSEYTTGVTTNGTPGSAGAYTRIVVADSAPTLYYYCSAHSGMGGTANTPAFSATGTVVVQGGTVIEFGGIAAATGGTITTDGDYKVHTFTSSGTFEVTSVTNNPTFDILQIAGGGGGGRRRGGGGGAGGYLYETGVSISAGLYGVTVGAGGTGAPSGSGSSTNGGDSSIDSLLAVSVGGGGGGGDSHGASGGSGGGGQGMTAGINAGTATSGQGNAGIAGSNLSYGGGGGGSGGAGSTKDGGAGTANSITGSPVTRAGGGGAWDAGAAGSGGASAGGTGTSAASNATANTGSGGGGGGDDAAGGDGGSGVVIVRYKFQGDQGSFSTGSKYYVQNDGTITTVSSSVNAGLALSTTSLLLNGDS